MKRGVFFTTAVLWSVCLHLAFSVEKGIDPLLSTNSAKVPEAVGQVTAVYGISADDYLPSTKSLSARHYLRPQLRTSGDHPTFDLPDGFFFIGGTLFILILLRVLVVFIDEFEERRKEELRVVASDKLEIE